VPRIDPHSYFDDAQPRTRSWVLRLRVDFEQKILSGTVELRLASPAGGVLDLDTKGLAIEGVAALGNGAAVPFDLASEEPILGRRLRLTLPPATEGVVIRYRTGPDAVGLQWLAPAQTEGKVHPFLFSQCQAIHARTLVPCQDCAVARVTYDAEVSVPAPLSAVMGAGPTGEGPAGPGWRTFRFGMPQAIPSYLLALAVGELEGRDLSARSRVWAEPGTVERAAWEFADTETLVRTAEALFGPYEWDRFDMLVLPPSFPYGGMENPRMTFLTPTLLAGDRSLVDVVAHELAHSWTGNLVTNSTAEHFWLNEGWTVFAERRILRALRGEAAASIAWAVGQKDLDESLERFRDQPELTKLRTHLAGVDPDDVFSSIPYEKGARFLVALERTVGEERFDRFIHAYMARFHFQSISTEAFCAFVEAELPGALARVNADAWLHQPGMPAGAPRFVSERLEALTALAEGWKAGRRPVPEEVATWHPTELLVYLQKLPGDLGAADCAWLDQALRLTGRGNYEILVQWLCIAARAGHEAVFPRIREVLGRVGRMKYVRPLYQALGRTEAGRRLAREIFAAAALTYHPLTRRAAEGVLDKYPA
jgi:aminopeptidase N